MDGGQITNSKNYGDIKGKQGAAGIVEDMSNQSNSICSVSKCINYGNVLADYSGGISSTMAGNCSISKSSNFGEITANALGGGIAALVGYSGENTSGYIEKSINAGKITTYKSCGGIVGQTVFNVNNCYNIGEIYDLSNIIKYDIGGIAGTITPSANINNSYSIGKISSNNTQSYIGNLAGSSNGNINNCYYTLNNYDSVGIQNDTNTYSQANGENHSIALELNELKNITSFTGFDFENVWNMNENETYLLPQLNDNELEGYFVNNVEIQNDISEITIGDEVELNVEVLPENATNKNIIWKVINNDGEATISENGLLTAVKEGSIKVRAIADDLGVVYDDKEITINPKPDIVYTKNDYSCIYDGNSHGIELQVETGDAQIKYMDENGEYTLDEMPKYSEIGTYTIKYQISKDNYNTVIDSNTVNIYGIRNIDTSLKIKNNILIVKNYIFNTQTICNKFDIHALTSEFIHLDKNKNTITSDLIKTGEYIKVLINNEEIEEYIISILGDVNGDGKISALDYVKIKNHIMKTTLINDDVYLESADVNEDGKISALDYVRIKNYIMNGGN